jgi:hypothetical protein
MARTAYVVVGRFTPADANPVTEVYGPVVEVGARTLEEAQLLALWYRQSNGRDGEIKAIN